MTFINKRILLGLEIFQWMIDQPRQMITAFDVMKHFDNRSIASNIIKRFKRAGLLESTRGIYGGYMISPIYNKISYYKVIEAIVDEDNTKYDENSIVYQNLLIADKAAINKLKNTYFEIY